MARPTDPAGAGWSAIRSPIEQTGCVARTAAGSAPPGVAHPRPDRTTTHETELGAWVGGLHLDLDTSLRYSRTPSWCFWIRPVSASPVGSRAPLPAPCIRFGSPAARSCRRTARLPHWGSGQCSTATPMRAPPTRTPGTPSPDQPQAGGPGNPPARSRVPRLRHRRPGTGRAPDRQLLPGHQLLHHPQQRRHRPAGTRPERGGAPRRRGRRRLVVSGDLRTSRQ